MKQTTIWLAVLVAGLCALAAQVLAFSSGSAAFSRNLEATSTTVETATTVTLSVENLDGADWRGFYLADHIPASLTVQTVSVKMNGVATTDFSVETTAVGDVFSGSRTYRWILETPALFSENQPVGTGETVEVVYTVVSDVVGEFDLSASHWVGHIASGPTPVFGYSEPADAVRVTFVEAPPPPPPPPPPVPLAEATYWMLLE